MCYKKENVNTSALLLILLLFIGFDYIFYYGYLLEKVEKKSLQIILLAIFCELIIVFRFVRNSIYDFEINDEGIIVKYKFKKFIEKYSFKDIDEIVFAVSQRNSMHNIMFHFSNSKKVSLPSSDKEEMKKIYGFYIGKEVKCRLVGLPSGRNPSDYKW